MALDTHGLVRFNRRRPGKRAARTLNQLPKVIDDAIAAAAGGNPQLAVVSKSADYTMTANDDVVIYTHSSGTKTLTLDAATDTRLRVVVQKDSAGTLTIASASLVNNVPSENIGGGSREFAIIVSTGSTFWMFSGTF